MVDPVPVVELVDDNTEQIDLSEDEFSVWPEDTNELMVRLYGHWSESTW